MTTFQQVAADRLADLIRTAPAGGVFHDAIISAPRVLHKGFANEQYHFTVATPEGELRIVVKPVLP